MHRQFSFWVLPQLWDAVVKEKCKQANNRTLSSFVEEFCISLTYEEWTVPYQVNRVIHSYVLKKEFAKEFPLKRRYILINSELMISIKKITSNKLVNQYGSCENLTSTAVVCMCLYLICIKNEIRFEKEHFFSDFYFQEKYVLSENMIQLKFKNLYGKLGRWPTAREYDKAEGQASLSYIKSQHGSYSQALTYYKTKLFLEK